MHDTLRVLEIEPFAQEIGRDEQVSLERPRRGRRPLCRGCECAQHFQSGRGAGGEPARFPPGSPEHRGDATRP